MFRVSIREERPSMSLRSWVSLRFGVERAPAALI